MACPRPFLSHAVEAQDCVGLATGVTASQIVVTVEFGLVDALAVFRQLPNGAFILVPTIQFDVVELQR